MHTCGCSPMFVFIIVGTYFTQTLVLHYNAGWHPSTPITNYICDETLLVIWFVRVQIARLVIILSTVVALCVEYQRWPWSHPTPPPPPPTKAPGVFLINIYMRGVLAKQVEESQSRQVKHIANVSLEVRLREQAPRDQV